MTEGSDKLCKVMGRGTLKSKALAFKGALDNFSLIPQFFSRKLRFLHH